MKIGKKLTVLFLLSLVLFISVTVTTLAWTNNTYILPQDVIGKSRKNYFAGGDGSSTTPFLISEPEHFFNLAYLQNSGQFNSSTYYFELTNSIDFSQAIVDLYKTVYPVGNEDYPFLGIFEGNFYTLSNFSIDGNGYQDIGVFGRIGNTDDPETTETEGVVQNLFIEQPTIISNPSTTDDKTNFHTHNDNLENRATGYIVGHLSSDAYLNNVFVVAPTINSLSNADTNRSQYGLVGYNAYDGGNITGSPRNAYNFDMDAASSYSALIYAYNTYGNSYINGSPTVQLNDVLSSSGYLSSGYSLSTMMIPDPDPNNAPVPASGQTLVFLYDQLVADGYPIGAGGSEYNRENIDVVGVIDFNSTVYQIYQNIGASGLTSPTVGTYFDANNYPNAIFLYVKPTNNLNDLGDVTGYYGGGGQLSYLSSYDSSGNYVAGRYWQNSQDPNLVNFGASGVTQTMDSSAAFCAVKEDAIDPVTGEKTYKVVDETVTPTYYVFLVAVTNGQITISDINFSYSPADLSQQDFASLGNIDYITTSQKQDIIDDSTTYAYYDFSYFYFNYDITVNQTIEVYTQKLYGDPDDLTATGGSNGPLGIQYYYQLNIDYSITDSSLFYFDIYNLNESVINLYINDVFDSGNPYSLIEIQFTSSGYLVSLP